MLDFYRVKMNKIIRYSGSKIKYSRQLNKLINYSDKQVYVEPFLGSGAIFLNLTKNFDKYIINDIDRNIVRIFKTMKEIEYEDFNNLYQNVLKTFGQINTKEGYYAFRHWFNITHWKKETLEEGVYLVMLANSCINSMMRFGVHGFNQGCGMRDFTPAHSKEIHENIKSRLQKTEIYNLSFFNLEIPNNSLLFVDPPYFYHPSYSYIGFNNQQFMNFIQNLKTTDNHVLYTDVIHGDLDWEYRLLREDMKTTSPFKKSESTGHQEVVYFNFNCIPLAVF